MELFIEYLKRNKISKTKQEILVEVGTLLEWEYNDILELYLLCFRKEDYSKPEKNIAYKAELEQDILQCAEKCVSFQHEELLEVLAVLCNFVQKVLPVGSVVELKKEFLNKIPNIDTVHNFRLVITNRFLVNDDRSFHTYGGTIYPISNFNGKDIICFSESLIDHVVFQGYSDEQEEAFVSLMKYELIIEKGKISAGLCTAK